MEHLKYRIIKQIVINLMWVAQGLIEMTGVCMHDLREQVNSDYEEISRTLAVQAGGLLVGAVSGGFLHEIFYKHTDLLTSGGLLLMGLVQLTIPWMPSLWLLCAAQFFIGAGSGILNTGGNPLVTDLWGEKAAAPLYSLHFGYGLGAMITSQMARPFLSDTRIEDSTILNHTYFNTSTPDPGASSRASRLEYPYSISGFVAIGTSILLIVLYLRGPPKGLYNRQPHKKLRILLSPGSCTDGRVTYGAILLFLTFLFYILNVGGERVFGSFVFSYAVDGGVAFSKDHAATLTTVFFISHLVGRFLGIFISNWVPIHWFILTDMTLALITWSIGAGLAYNNAAAVWGITAVSGAFISVLWPAGVAWINMYMQPNSMAVMLFMMGTACGNFAYQYITGYLFELYGVRCFMYILVQNALCILLLFTIMQLAARTQGSRFSRDAPDANPDVDQANKTSQMNEGINPSVQGGDDEEEMVVIPPHGDIKENVPSVDK